MAKPREHFVIAVRRQECTRFLLWYSGDIDGLVVAPDGRSLFAFATDADARAHAAAASLLVSPTESAYFDFDELAAWIASPNPYRLKPDILLNAWNLLGDVARSAGDDIAFARLLDRRDLQTYDDLASCCSIPALGFPTRDRLSADDCAAIAAILRHGLACFDTALPEITPAPPPR